MVICPRMFCTKRNNTSKTRVRVVENVVRTYEKKKKPIIKNLVW